MTQEKLIKLLKQGESEGIEFKEGTKNVAKTICAFSNTQGGYILIGINDEGSVVGVKNKYQTVKQKISNEAQSIYPSPHIAISSLKIDKKTIVVIEIKKIDKLFSVGNVVYIRLGANNRPLSTQEVIEKAGESVQIFFDSLPCKESQIKDLNQKKLRSYLEKRKDIRGVVIRGSLADNLLKIRAAVKIKQKIIPTYGGVLFFAKTPQKFINHNKIRLVHFQDDQMRQYVDSQEFSGTLDDIVSSLHEYFVKNLKTMGGFLVGFKREEFKEYPLDALREAVINGLIHRNYFDPSEIRIFIFPDRIEIKNPGSFPPGVTPEEPEHKPRNPYLSQYMYDVGYTEKYGSGILKIKEECRQHPLVNVYYKIKPFFTTVIFRKDKKFKIEKIDEDILGFIKAKQQSSSSEIAKHIGRSRQTVVSRLRKLFQLGLVQKKGKARGVKYYIL